MATKPQPSSPARNDGGKNGEICLLKIKKQSLKYFLKKKTKQHWWIGLNPTSALQQNLLKLLLDHHYQTVTDNWDVRQQTEF